MRIVWDEPKRQQNLIKHGLDFAAVTLTFFETAMIRPARHDRHLAIGRLDTGQIVAVVFRPLGREALSIVSMRRASKAERSLP